MSDMKCPFCGKELEPYWYEDFECWYCPDINCKGYSMSATDDMWQELIRTRKALDVAKDGLQRIADAPIGYCMFAEETLEQITELEQKD